MTPREAEDKASRIMRARAAWLTAARTAKQRKSDHPLDVALADAQTREDIAQALADLDAAWARRLEQRQRGLARWLGKVRQQRAARRLRNPRTTGGQRCAAKREDDAYYRAVARDVGVWAEVRPARPAEGTEA